MGLFYRKHELQQVRLWIKSLPTYSMPLTDGAWQVLDAPVINEIEKYVKSFYAVKFYFHLILFTGSFIYRNKQQKIRQRKSKLFLLTHIIYSKQVNYSVYVIQISMQHFIYLIVLLMFVLVQVYRLVHVVQ
jgi:hypothetical protein